jgi:hypothetical protein
MIWIQWRCCDARETNTRTMGFRIFASSPANGWPDGRSRRLASRRRGLLVLGIECPGGEFIGAPAPDTEIRELDSLILYGRTPRIAEIDRRRGDGTGERSHIEAVEEQKNIALAERSAAGR